MGQIFGMTACFLLAVFMWHTQRRIQSNFRSYEWTHFDSVYEEAAENQESWLEDPNLVALRLAGYPNRDGILPDNLFIHLREAERQIVVVSQTTKVFDDSISGIETWVELEKTGPVWEVVWAGRRVRCARHGLSTFWRTQRCP